VLVINDKSGKPKFVLFDNSKEPISIDEIIIRETKKESAIKVEEDDNEDPKSSSARS
jgi:hypothetical protein